MNSKKLKVFLKVLSTLLWPPSCLSCGILLRYKRLYCKDCEERILDLALFDVPAKEPLDSLQCLADYSGGVKQILAKVKFDDRKDCADFLAKRIKPLIQDKIKDFDFIFPVPSHKSRFMMRGFYVVDQVFKPLLPAQQETCLFRKYPSLPSYLLSKKLREWQLHNAFECWESAKLKGAHVLLLDDVVSSQSTLIACAACLKAAGAKHVAAIGLAYKKA